jgi:putative sigma-54 modulation protein
MPLHITGRHLEIPAGAKGYIEKKMARLERHFDRIDVIAVTVASEKNSHLAEINFSAGTIHAFTKGSGTTINAAIDVAVDKLENQITRAKAKRNGNKKHVRRPVIKLTSPPEGPEPA